MDTELLLFLAQRTQQAPNAAFATGALIGTLCGLLIMLSMLAGGIWAIIRWPNESSTRMLLSFPMILLPFTGPIIFGFFMAIEEKPPDGTIFAIPIGWIIWIVLFLYMQGQIRAYDRARNADILDAQARHHGGPRRGPAMPGQRGVPGRPRLPGAPAPQPEDEVLDEVPDEPPPPPKPQKPKLTRDTPVVARCKACMGRWKTTAGEAKDLNACPKCGASPPDLRLQRND